jgi:DNA polymerase type B, organellar and viral
MARKLAVFDFETDPFKFGRIPVPFSWGFFDGEKYSYDWGEKCITNFLNFLEDTEDDYLIYAHNGGKFDFMFFIEHFRQDIKIVNGRILEAKIGRHIFRDSYAILPIPLSAYGKDEIDYDKMEKEVRDQHRDEILSYLKTDCTKLFELVSEFVKEFGDILTIGGAAIKELKKFHKFETASSGYDKFFRKYYFGGRCQCFETGIIRTPIKIFDVNSMYPFVMSDSLHPVSVDCDVSNSIGKNTAFVSWTGFNFGAVPTRLKNGLNFNVKHSKDTEEKFFHSTIHEFNAGLETGTIKPQTIKSCVDFKERMTFFDFVDHFYKSRNIAKANGDKFHDIFYKLILNSSYGKFAQNPDGFQDSIILPWPEVAPEGYEIEYRHDDYAIWSKPSGVHTYYNVATAASITGAARALLLRGIAQTKRPLYCDTDSIICNDLKGNLHDKNLGAWKTEATGDMIAIAGKKLYAVMDGDTCVKKASKGVRLEFEQIIEIANGGEVEYQNPAPSFKLNGAHQFIKRRITRTK